MQGVNEEELKQIMAETDCPRDFACYKSDFENLCPVKVIAGGSLIECISDECSNGNPTECKSRMSFGFSHLCNCPVRAYIAKNLRK